jgi:hypothetical protein
VTQNFTNLTPPLDTSISPPKHAMELPNEENVQLAIQGLQSGKFKSARSAAAAHHVGWKTVTRRMKGIPPKAGTPSQNRLLTPVEEEVVYQKVLDLDARGYSPTQAVIRGWASSILSIRNGQEVGEKWAYHFIKRKPGLKTILSRRLSYQRAKNEDPDIIQAWFRLVQNTIKYHGITDQDIYNFDESGFRLGHSQNTMVVTATESRRRPKALVSDSTQWQTVIACVNAQGWSVPPYVIFAGKEMNRAWFHCLPPTWKLGVSPKGWTSFDHGTSWIKHFNEYTKHRTVGQKRLLILDGHESHMTPEFEAFCKEEGIVTLCMPPHSSHLLQPLDVGCFGPLKRAYSKRITRLGSVGYHYLIKEDFLPELSLAYKAAFTPTTIRSSFRGSGLLPLDPEAVLSKLTLRQKTPTLPPPPSSQELYQTPQNPRQVEKHTSYLKDKVVHHQGSSPTPILEVVDRLSKSCQQAQTTLALVQAENENIKTIIIELQSHRALRKRIKLTHGIDTDELAERDMFQSQALQVMDLVEANEKKPRAKPTCSKCGVQGHNVRGCSSDTVASGDVIDPLLRQLESR